MGGDKIILVDDIEGSCLIVGCYHDRNLFFTDKIYNHKYLEGFMKLLDISPEEFFEKLDNK